MKKTKVKSLFFLLSFTIYYEFESNFSIRFAQ
jgi:hypothetical protein